MKKTIALAAATAALSFGATFTGVITDTMCAGEGHKSMNMGTDAKCVVECVKGMNAKYALYDATSKTVWVLSDQKTPEKFAGRKVTVTGTVDAAAKTIQVDSIAAAK
jgi:hypothetical protein